MLNLLKSLGASPPPPDPPPAQLLSSRPPPSSQLPLHPFVPLAFPPNPPKIILILGSETNVSRKTFRSKLSLKTFWDPNPIQFE